MAKLTKKQKALEGKVDSNKLYPLVDAFGIVKEAATAKFDETIHATRLIEQHGVLDWRSSNHLERQSRRITTRMRFDNQLIHGPPQT